MRVFIAVLVLIFSLQSWTKADDISDFEIEGMSVGDSALDYFSEEFLLSSKSYSWDNKKFALSNGKSKNDEFFKYWQLYYLDKDPKYIIHFISGYTDISNLEDCNKNKIKLVENIKSIAPNARLNDLGKTPHPGDPSGKSIAYKFQFHFEDEALIMVTCTFYSEDYKNKYNLLNNLSVSAHSKEFSIFLLNEAYK